MLSTRFRFTTRFRSQSDVCLRLPLHRRPTCRSSTHFAVNSWELRREVNISIQRLFLNISYLLTIIFHQAWSLPAVVATIWPHKFLVSLVLIWNHCPTTMVGVGENRSISSQPNYQTLYCKLMPPIAWYKITLYVLYTNCIWTQMKLQGTRFWIINSILIFPVNIHYHVLFFPNHCFNLCYFLLFYFPFRRQIKGTKACTAAPADLICMEVKLELMWVKLL